MKNLYGDGHASQRIVEVLTTVSLDGLLRKRAANNNLENELS
jgi:UDP-N-acetylglucosamine 2-epimerase